MDVALAMKQPPPWPSAPPPLICGVANAPPADRAVEGATQLGGGALGVGAAKCTPLGGPPVGCMNSRYERSWPARCAAPTADDATSSQHDGITSDVASQRDAASA
eukprot:7067705-Prymnesium_polylepis.2